ncbi:divalent metal cation transporter, partial [Vibrio parahaemolyticus]|nr:divalent metal cation transporter [Vibrio parahaemolyticus]
MDSAVIDKPQSKLSLFFRSLGPGILMASAAVGGSHLVASTKAGAIYGWQL